jgi:hypothetical protein
VLRHVFNLLLLLFFLFTFKIGYLGLVVIEVLLEEKLGARTSSTLGRGNFMLDSIALFLDIVVFLAGNIELVVLVGFALLYLLELLVSGPVTVKLLNKKRPVLLIRVVP